MSLNHAVLGLLAEQPMSGFDLIREFDVAQSLVWPAPQNEVYRVLAKLRADGLIAEGELGARGRKTYAITDLGRSSLAEWIGGPSNYTLRYDPLLKAAFLGAMPPAARRERAQADLAFFTGQLAILEKSEARRAGDGGPDRRADVRRMVIGMYAALAEWSRTILASEAPNTD